MLTNISHKSLLFLIICLLIPGCKPNFPAPQATLPVATYTLLLVSATPDIPTGTPVPTFTSTETATPTPEWMFQSGTITCPILLYHRIAEPPSPNSSDARYYTPPEAFTWQMQALKDWGYTSIPISLLVTAITKGALLPPRPVVISFDDGYETVFENAYPIMKELGFTGLMYIVGEYVGAQGYMSIENLVVLSEKGWEIGSHSMTHPHLPANHDIVYFEAGQSKNILASEIGVNILTFAYPYGEMDGFVVDKVAEYGYLAAVGLGTQYTHSMDTLYYLSRIEVRYDVNKTSFASLLPWSSRP
jgi:peptidoglycan/xylan/chitin deacetylase (PgdA/CDA1 family)